MSRFISNTSKASLLGLPVALVLSGCSVLNAIPIPGMDYIAGEEGLLRDRQGDYLEAEVLPPTRIPSQYDSYIIDDLMVIPPETAGNQQAFLVAPRPRAFTGRSDRGVVIQRMSGASWVVVDASPSAVWPRVRDYWRQKRIQVAFENPTAGILDTGWFVLQDNQLTKEKVRVTIEPGFQNDSAEIRLLHLGVSQALPALDQVNWPETSTDPDVEYDFLTDLSNYLADIAGLYQASTVSFLAENIESQGKASIVSTPGGRDILRLDAGYDRSWAAISGALKRAGIDIVAQDSETGVFEVDFVIPREEEEEKPGFFRKVVTLNGIFSSEEPEQFYPMKIRVLDLNGEVEVIIESLQEGPAEVDGEEDPAKVLLQVIRTNIA